MALILGQASVPGNATVAVFSIPPGTVSTIIYQPTTAQSVFIGTSARMSSANGLMVPVTPVNIDSYVSSSGATIFATTGNATTSTFSYLISTGA